MNKELVKELLLRDGLFEDNEWLNDYCQLIEDNELTPHILRTTNSHHIIPKHVHCIRGLLPADSEINRVNLSKIDHALAHYYLYKCALNEECKRDNLQAYNLLQESI